VYHRSFRRYAARSIIVLAAALAGLVAAEGRARACGACGCDVYDVGSISMFPDGPGGRVYLDYQFQDLHLCWRKDSRAPEFDDNDKRLETHFLTLGVQYMFNPDWGIQAELPYELRRFTTIGGATGSEIVTIDYHDLGDMRVKGIYDGFFDDHSLGVTFGLKLPTGNYTANNVYGDVDRDAEIGSGSVAVLLGGFLRQEITSYWHVFAQVQFDLPIIDRDQYYPGYDFDAAIGTYWTWEVNDTVKFVPVAQIINSSRTRDSGLASAHPVQSGYERIEVSPGLEVDIGPIMFYADAEVPVFVHTLGYQLTAPLYFKASVGYKF